MDKVQLRFSQAKFSSQDPSSKRFTRMYARDSPFVRRVLLQFGIPTRDVDDLVQNVFVTLWQRLDRVVGDTEVRPWLYVVASNLAKNYRCRHRYWKEQFVEVMPEPEVKGVDCEWVIDAYRRLERLWRRMRPKIREVFVRVMLEGQTVREVARELGIPLKTVEARIRLVRDRVLRGQGM